MKDRVTKSDEHRRIPGARPPAPVYAVPGANPGSRAYGAPAGPQQLRTALASPAAYVVVGALAGVLLGLVIARR